MPGTRFLVALVVVVAGTYLWYQRGLVNRDHELCLDVTRTLMDQQTWGVEIDKGEHFERYIDIYTSWYSHCRLSRFATRNDLTLVTGYEEDAPDSE